MPEDSGIEIFETEVSSRLGAPIPVDTPAEVSSAWTREGFELALAPESVPERSLRRVWRDRLGQRAIPLLLVAPGLSDGASVAVVGPREGEPQEVPPAALAELIDSAKDLNANTANRRLAQSIRELGSMAIPGVMVHGLLTEHYVRTRLSTNEHRAALAEAAAMARDARGAFEVLRALGYEVQERPNDYLALSNGTPVAVIWRQASPELFSRMDESGRLPEGVLIAACRSAGTPWGMMIAGDRLRLFEAHTDRGAATERWIDIDAAGLSDSYQHLLGLLAPVSLAPDGVLPELMTDALTFGSELRERLDEQIRRFALPNIARGLGQWLDAQGEDLAAPEVRERIQKASYTLLFRLLFILYAESAGYLPYDNSAAYRRNAVRTLCNDARDRLDQADPASTTLWDSLRTLVNALRSGNRPMDVPQYNGSLFDAVDLPGADLLEAAAIHDDCMAPALDALGFDYAGSDEAGIDYTGLEIGHLGAIYEGLLALRLSLADQSYRLDSKAAKGQGRYVPAEEPGDDGVAKGQLFFQTEAGGRKGGGVYYTRQEFVRHLVNHSVVPALDEHLEQVRTQARTDPEAAARLLFRFRVLDPAMGSGHFLVDALDVIAERVHAFLADTPNLPLRKELDALRAEAQAHDVDDARLLKRLLVKHSVYGVDLSEMAVELARVALWLSSFVPGLALSYLDQTLKLGDSLVGVASIKTVVESSGSAASSTALWAQPNGVLDQAIKEAGELATQIADLADRNKDEVSQSRDLRAQLEERIQGVRRVFDLWTAEPFGVEGARAELDRAEEIIEGTLDVAEEREKARLAAEEAKVLGRPEPVFIDIETLIANAQTEAANRSFFHWPIEFPEVFHRSRERNPGFDAVIGNPPWKNLRVDELSFFALHDPGLRGVRTARIREERIDSLVARFGNLRDELASLREIRSGQAVFFSPGNGYRLQGAGHLDLYELFCERYTSLARPGGHMGIVLPRVALLGKGNTKFRQWLYNDCSITRCDFLLNSGRWAFDMEARYTIVLLAARITTPTKGGGVTMTGPSTNPREFAASSSDAGVDVSLDELARWTSPAAEARAEPTWETPILGTDDAARIFRITRNGVRFDAWALQSGSVFALQGDMNETTHKKHFAQGSGTAVWKGKTFGLYDPRHGDPVGYGEWEGLIQFLEGKRARSPVYRKHFSDEDLATPASHPVNRARIAFRDSARATDSRTVIACLVPPHAPLTHTAWHIVFPDESSVATANLLGILGSTIFDWQARRIVESHVSGFILDLLCLPANVGMDQAEVATRSARLSCVDERFSQFAEECGVDYGPLSKEKHATLRTEIDAFVAHGYGLEAADLEVIFNDFTLKAVSEDYRELVRQKFAEVAS